MRWLTLCLLLCPLGWLTGCETANYLRLRSANNALLPQWPAGQPDQQFSAWYLGEKPYIHIRVQGPRGETQSLLMLLDTGASFSMLFDSPAVRQLHLPQGYPLSLGGWGDQQDSQAWQTKVARLSLAEVHFDDVQLAYIPASRSPYFLRPDELVFDGVIGHDLLRHFRWTFDRQAQLIGLSARPYQPVAADISLPLQESWRKISVAGTLAFNAQQQVRRDFIIDTGSRHYLKLSAAYPPSQQIALPATQVTAADFGLSGKTEHQRVTLTGLQLGALQLKNIHTNLIPSDDPDDWWVLGSALLNQFVSVIDYPAQQLYLRPYHGQPFRSRYNLAGLELRKIQSGAFVVRYLFPQLPAADSGLQVGDLIEQINGLAASDLSEADWLALTDQPQPLKLCTASRCVQLESRPLPGYSVP